MIKLQELTINQPIEIGLEINNRRRWALSRVVDLVNDRTIRVSAPTLDGDIVPMSAGDAVDILYTSASASWSVSAKVISRESQPIQSLIIEVVNEPIRTQRREYVRVATSLPIVLSWTEDHVGNECKGIVTDISGGGIAVAFKNDTAPSIGIMARVSFKLPEKPDPIVLRTKVVRVKGNKHDGWSIGLDFGELSNTLRESIISYTFHRQRQLIAEGRLKRDD